MQSLSGRAYALAAGWRIAAFLALSIGFPLIVLLIAKATGCARVGGACGAVASLAGMYLRPIIVLSFVAAIVHPTIKRAKTLGLHWVFGLVVPLLLLADGQFLILWGAHWSVAFSLGVLHVQPPIYAGVALLAAALLAVAQPPHEGGPPGRSYGFAASATGAIVLLLALFAVASLALGLAPMFGATPVPIRALVWMQRISQVVGAGAAAGLAALICIEISRRFAGRGRATAT